MSDRIKPCQGDSVKFVLYIQGGINVAVCAYKGYRKNILIMEIKKENSWINMDMKSMKCFLPLKISHFILVVKILSNFYLLLNRL